MGDVEAMNPERMAGESSGAARSMRGRSIVALALTLLAGCSQGDGSDKSTSVPAATPTISVPRASPPAATNPPAAENLARLDHNAPPSSSEVRPYTRALSALGRKCSGGTTHLGDLAVTAVRLLGDAGIDETNLDVLRHVRGSIPAAFPRGDCSSLFAGYVTLRKQG